MYLNVSFALNSAGGGVVLISPKGDQLLYVIRLHFHATNNVAEYEALINILRFTVELGVLRLYIHGDFELIINQVMGESNYHDSCMVLSFTISSARDNEADDALAQLGSSRKLPPLGMFAQDLFMSSIQLEEDIPVPAPGTFPDEDSFVPVPRTLLGQNDPASELEVNPGSSPDHLFFIYTLFLLLLLLTLDKQQSSHSTSKIPADTSYRENDFLPTNPS
jgi:hypothetical protein